jgi:hypothetical protein
MRNRVIYEPSKKKVAEYRKKVCPESTYRRAAVQRLTLRIMHGKSKRIFGHVAEERPPSRIGPYISMVEEHEASETSLCMMGEEEESPPAHPE